jgi:hypothetical protein
VQPTPPPPPEVNFQYFHDQLSPWGTWVEVPGVGACWQPSAAVTGISPDWRPYYDNGQWVQTDNGLYWQSEYQWGDIPFHYGRWILQPGYGWVWVPDYTWGPAWVFWRQDDVDGCIGWAPLPYGAVFINGGFWWHGVAVGVDFDFGLGMACFTFCPYGHFHEPFFRMRGHEWAYHIGQDRMRAFYGHSVIRNEFRRDEHGRFVNNGIGRDRIEHLTRVEHANFEERNPVGDRNKLAAARTEQSRGRDTAGTDRLSRDTTRTTMESGASHGPNGTEHTTQSAKASMVYRPPSTSNAGAGRTATPNTGGGHTPAAGGGSPNQHH